MKYLFIGLGGIGQRHLRNLKSICSENDEFYAYRVRREQFVLNNRLQIEENENLEKKYNLKVFDDLEKALEIHPDIVFVCNPTSLHMDVMLKIAENGCHFFVEKPLSNNMEKMDLLQDYIRNKNLITYVGYQQRYNPCVIKAKEVLSSGELGDILSVNAEIGECIKNWHKYEDYRRMYAARKELGGGVVLSQIHELDYLYYFFGMPVSAYAVGGQISDLEVDVEDVADILLKYQMGDRYFPVHIHEDYIQTPASRTCKIIGNRGRIEFDLIEAKFVQYDKTGNCVYKEEYNFERNDMFVNEMKSFLESVKNKKESKLPVDVGIYSLKMAMGILDSLDTGEVIFFDQNINKN